LEKAQKMVDLDVLESKANSDSKANSNADALERFFNGALVEQRNAPMTTTQILISHLQRHPHLIRSMSLIRVLPLKLESIALAETYDQARASSSNQIGYA
jgi:hypothetical protein